ncbi:hypothetical protein [Neptunicella sp. SCSIO 80796]|uniref:hypothetical protein n=1 Tax=Neptunicella plasticusilytica TaxID=3117012 RepID=UPI003A4E3BD5
MTDAVTAFNGTDSSFNWGNVASQAFDSFSGLLGSYAQYRIEEKKAENTGASQAAVNNAVEKPYNVGAVPNQSTGQVQTATQIAGYSLDTKTMLMIGGGIALGLVIFKKVL